ncbi:four helix bundle protein [Lutimonas vermicola]|uniref:Four helix bundle protein n=1 Tax=Lutimonas vermicola TaxID=414288 RepID=A0ABU9KZM8_9FLAO
MHYKNDLSHRLLHFSADVIQMSKSLPKSQEFEIIKYQLIKSATSVGANYQESQSASSLADFRNKIRISLKEISETSYWIQLVKLIQEKSNNNLNAIPILQESKELEKILGRINQKIRKKQNIKH